jgi:copper resistance protein C
MPCTAGAGRCGYLQLTCSLAEPRGRVNRLTRMRVPRRARRDDAEHGGAGGAGRHRSRPRRLPVYCDRYRKTRSGSIVILGLPLVALLLLPAHAEAHAALVRSSPAQRAVLLRGPERVQLWFNERLEAEFSQLSVRDRTGQQVDLRDVRVGPDDPKKLSVGVRGLGPGTYTVRYRVLSVDGHVVEAEFPFTVREP